MLVEIPVQVPFITVLKSALEEHGKDKLAESINELLNEQLDFKLAYTLRNAINLHITNNS